MTNPRDRDIGRKQNTEVVKENRGVLTHSWRAWVAENKLLGISNETITEILRQHGMCEGAIGQELSEIESHPYFSVARTAREKLSKLESLLNIRHDLLSLSSQHQIERRSKIARSEFLEHYYAANRPVILADLIENKSVLTRWNVEHLRRTCGDTLVEIMAGRNSDPDYELNSAEHKSTIRFADYIDLVEGGHSSNDIYLVANNLFFTRSDTQVLYPEIPKFPEFLDETRIAGQVFLWFGPAGTITPLHHDLMNILVVQIRGRKRFSLVSPEQTQGLYNDIGVYSGVDPEKPDFSRHPLFRDVTVNTITLEAGDALFLPVGWWHHVRSLDISLTLSYTNFVFPNKFAWTNPSGGS